MEIWEKAYANTTNVVFGIGTKKACKKCDEITKTEATDNRQLLGNCYQFVVKCTRCSNHFVVDYKQ